MQSSTVGIWTRELSLKQGALVAGFTYLLNPVTFAEGYVMPQLESGDSAETVTKLTVGRGSSTAFPWICSRVQICSSSKRSSRLN